MKSLVNKFNAVNKAYVDRIKNKTATGTIPKTVMTDRTLYTFPTAKAFASGNYLLLLSLSMTTFRAPQH